ncbi:MAG TPA: hypothetical protein VLL96_07125, partial [Candidatus Deferrimicrobiaceae bacterium]|nr:hypothetical protein [Candidatus Deferrimicrobiaceae bacterium]
MQVERGKTRPNTMMTGHTGYITHARKIIKPPTQETPQTLATEQIVINEDAVENQENMDDLAEKETA